MADPHTQPPRLFAVVAACFAPAVIFVSIANNVLLGNSGDQAYRARLPVAFVAAFAAAAAMSAPTFLRAHRSRTAAAFARCCLFVGAGVLVLSWARVGLEGRVPNFAVAAVVDQLVLLALAVAVIRTPLPWLHRVLGTVAVALVAQAGVLHGQHAWQARRARVARQQASHAPLRPPPPVGNIYHIVLDAYQTEAYQVIVAQDPTLALPGFALYPAFKASYWFTPHSLANVFTGRTWRAGERPRAWDAEALNGGLWAALAQHGVQLHLYPFNDRYCTSPHAQTCASTQGLRDRARAQLAGPPSLTESERTLIDIWFFALMPQSVQLLGTPGRGLLGDVQDPFFFAVPPSFSLTRRLWPLPAGRPGGPAADAIAALPDPHLQGGLASLATFRQLMADEATRPPRGQYVFAHLMLPHSPNHLDADCARTSGRRTLDGYLGQAACAMKLMRDFTDCLADLGRLDAALIIIHGDHGASMAAGARLRRQYPEWFGPDSWSERIEEFAEPTAPPPGGTLRWFSREELTWEMAALRANALLLVKFPGATDAFVSAQAPLMIDLAPTMLKHIDASARAFPGVPLEDLPADLVRDRRMYYTTPWTADPEHVPAFAF